MRKKSFAMTLFTEVLYRAMCYYGAFKLWGWWGVVFAIGLVATGYLDAERFRGCGR